MLSTHSLIATIRRLTLLAPLATILFLFVSTQGGGASSRHVSIHVSSVDGEPAFQALVRACSISGSWYSPDQCVDASQMHTTPTHSLSPLTVPFHILVTYQHRTWYYSASSSGDLSPSPADATVVRDPALLPETGLHLRISTAAATLITSYTVDSGPNLIGWAGAEITARELFAQAPTVEAIWARSGPDQHYRFAGRYLPRTHSLSIPHGSPLWLYVGDTTPHSLTFSTPQPAFVPVLPPGTAYTAYTGTGSTSLSHIATGLGTAATSITVLDRLGNPTTRDTVEPGDVLAIQLTAPRALSPYITGSINLIHGNQRSDSDISDFLRILEAKQQWYWQRLGVSARALSVYWGSDIAEATGRPAGSSWALPHRTWITNEWYFEHEYFHVLQYTLGPIGSVPRWLVEGTANWAQWLYRDKGTESEHDYLDGYRRAVRELPSRGTVMFTDPDRYDRGDFWQNYGLGMMAAIWLSNEYGEDSIMEFWRSTIQLDRYHWDELFARAFGTTVEEFDVEFMTYRGELNAQAMELPPYVPVEGCITNSSGNSVEGQLVNFLPEWTPHPGFYYVVRTNLMGCFELQVEPGKYSIRLQAESFRPIGYYRRGDRGNFTSSIAARTIVDANEFGMVEMQLPD